MPRFRAQKMLEQVRVASYAEPIVALIKPHIRKLAEVSRMRRAGLALGCAAYPLFSSLISITMMHLVGSTVDQHPEVAKLGAVLNHRNAQTYVPEHRRVDDELFEIRIASEFKDVVENPKTWKTPYSKMMIAPHLKAFAIRSAKSHPDPDPAKVAQAQQLLEPVENGAGGVFLVYRRAWFPALIVGATMLTTVAIPALIAALAFRGGLIMLIAGVAVARFKDGVRASRLRVFLRSMIAWTPMMAGVVAAAACQPLLGQVWTTALCVFLMLGIPALSLLIPGRGIQDRIAGTVLIPR
ncbi:MAG: hypothetical protein AAF585_26130 [Verrucomicrobiota bacterium]